MSEKSSEDELPQLIPAGMRPLIDDIRLLGRNSTNSKSRVKDFMEVDGLIDHLNKEGQRQRRRIKDYIEVKDLKEHLKDRPRDEERNKQMTEHPPTKEYNLRSREKQSAVSNNVIQIVRSEVGQRQQRQHYLFYLFLSYLLLTKNIQSNTTNKNN